MESNEVVEDVNIPTLIQLERENTSKLFEILQKLYGIWNNVGVDDEQKVNRATQVWGYLFETLKDIVVEETELYEDIKERIKNYEKKISELLVELQLPQGEEIIGTLIVKEETLRQQLDKLSKMKHKRVKEFQELRAQERKLCKILGMPPLNLSSTTGVPSEQDIYELKQHMIMLQGEKENRQKKYYKLKKELTTILEVTELTPDSFLEKQILSQGEDTLTLSAETLKLMEQMVTKTKGKQADMENEKIVLMDKLTMLWDILKIDKKEKELFLSKHTDCCVSNLNAIKEEIARCEKIKRDNILKYVDALKEELISLWDKCFISWSHNMLPRIDDDDIKESVLESYDNEVKKWWKYYKDTEHIIKKIKERQDFWDQLIIFENKATDPNRFKNRGGNLLQEERQRKQLQKALPKLEEKIVLDIKNYEEHSGKPFLYFGEKFENFMEKQWQERNSQKENEKLTRQKMRTNLTINERTRLTSGKRPFVGTPKSAPSKLFKSSVGMSVFRTPNSTALRQLPKTVAPQKNNRMQSGSAKMPERSILREKNEKSSVSRNLDSTTYTDFAVKLERSSRIAHRSSVLSSRKIVGTRLSRSKRKSVNKPTRKSLRKKIDTSKLTPARGKLGLPFLI